MRKMLWIGGSLAVAWLAVQGVYVVRVVRAHRRAKHTQALRRWRVAHGIRRVRRGWEIAKGGKDVS